VREEVGVFFFFLMQASSFCMETCRFGSIGVRGHYTSTGHIMCAHINVVYLPKYYTNELN